jgi:phosphoribosylaminoimidazolecarboxamide formyltransferase/IMP cyclohydrolase
MKVASHAKSNAIVISKNFKTVCIAAGHTSRIDALEFAAFKASKLNKSLKNAVMASDAFFPFDDCVKMAANLGIIAIIQPGGSIRDKDSIKAAENAGLTMVFTGNRHFRH